VSCCPDCDAEVELFRSADRLDAEMLAGALKEAGIASTVRSDVPVAALGGMGSQYAPGRWTVVVVAAAAEEDAREVIAAIRGGPPVLHAVENEPLPAGFYARRKRTIGAIVLVPFVLPFLIAFSVAVVTVVRELAR
jgi:hypothetical protein